MRMGVEAACTSLLYDCCLWSRGALQLTGVMELGYTDFRIEADKEIISEGLSFLFIFDKSVIVH